MGRYHDGCTRPIGQGAIVDRALTCDQLEPLDPGHLEHFKQAGFFMALGKRKREQQELWVATHDLPRSPGHPFYQKLNEPLNCNC